MSIRDRLRLLYGDPSPSGLRGRLERLEVRTGRDELAIFLGGRWIERQSGRVLVVEREFGQDFVHGNRALRDVYDVDARAASCLAGTLFEEFDPESALFFDTETTGLAGGAGTYVFLVGAGFFRDRHFHLRQYFLPDYQVERAFLEELVELVSGGSGAGPFRCLVSFNGKAYDLNLLQSRFILKRVPFPFGGLPHVDLLYPSRSFWRNAFANCALQTLESALLDLRRSGDIPSALIPGIYFDYLRTGRYRAFDRVFEHNRTDILSLAALLGLAARAVCTPGTDVDPRAVARLHGRRGNGREAVRFLEHAVGSGGVQTDASVELARLLRRQGEAARALEILEQALRASKLPPEAAFEEAAKLLEHEEKDFKRALQLVEKALVAYPESVALRRRQYRLACRLEGRRWF